MKDIETRSLCWELLSHLNLGRIIYDIEEGILGL